MERSTKPLASKLALKAGQTFLVLGDPKGYLEKLGELPPGVTMTNGPKADAVQAFASSKKEMKEGLAKAKAALNPGGMIWLTYPKQTSKVKSEINRDTIREYASSVGLETVALVAVDDYWSALRLKVTRGDSEPTRANSSIRQRRTLRARITF